MNAGELTVTEPVSWLKLGRSWAGRNASGLGLAVAALSLAYLTEGTFLSARNLTNLARQVSINGILAVGMTYVIILGGIDLSVGSVVALAGIVAGLLQVNAGWAASGGALGAVATVLASVAVGLLCGIFNGWWVTRQKVAPFIITLGMMVVARGLSLILAGGAAIAPLGEEFNTLGQGYLAPVPSLALAGACACFLVLRWARRGERDLASLASLGGVLALVGGAAWAMREYRGLPLPVLVFALIAFAGALILNQTRVGRFVLAIGGNPEAAWLAGVDSRRITFWVYAILGALAGLSGAILSARLNGALPTAGELFELDAIAAVVIGGTSLAGGVGTVRGSVLGAFLIGILNNGMSLLNVTEFYQKVAKGVIIVLAVWLDTRERARRE